MRSTTVGRSVPTGVDDGHRGTNGLRGRARCVCWRRAVAAAAAVRRLLQSRQSRRRRYLHARRLPPRADFARSAPCRGPAPPIAQARRSTENMFLRSWTNELYLWFAEVPDTNPNSIADVHRLFRPAEDAPSRRRRATPRIVSISHRYRRVASRCRRAASRSATAREMMILATAAAAARSRRVRRARHAGGQRRRDARHGGPRINSVDFVNDNTQAGVDTLNAAFFPSAPARRSRCVFASCPTGPDLTAADDREHHAQASAARHDDSRKAPTRSATCVFNDHIATAEKELFDAITRLRTQASTT